MKQCPYSSESTIALNASRRNSSFCCAQEDFPTAPGVRRVLEEIGENIRLARLRRGFSMALVVERAGMSLPTLRAVEGGEPGVTLGSYANALHGLGLHDDLALIVHDDELGRKLQDAGLPTRRCAPKRPARHIVSSSRCNHIAAWLFEAQPDGGARKSDRVHLVSVAATSLAQR